MKRVAGAEDKLVVSIPEVVRITIVAVEPPTVLIVLHVEDVQIAIRIAECRGSRLVHCPLNTLRAVESPASSMP